MTIDIERLKTDREYWDEHAPEGATRAGITHTDGLCWYKEELQGFSFLYHGLARRWERCSGDPYHTPLIHRPEPSLPEWDGEGLPPVGCECECAVLKQPFREFEVLGYNKERVWLFGDGVGHIVEHESACEFRPTRTKEQRVRDELIEIIGKQRPTISELADAILRQYNLETKQ